VKAALVISDRDNVATALQRLEPGRRLDFGAVTVVVSERVQPGHKLALRAIALGEPIFKYGSPIGTATADIPAGAHVHTHNLASGRGRGDLALPPSTAQPRLAEPIGGAPGDAEPAGNR